MNTEEMENILRQAPKPEPPLGLKERLVEQVKRSPARTSAHAGATNLSSGGGWLRRWWPVLSPATVSLACGLVFTMQQMEIHDLKQSIAALPQPTSKTNLGQEPGASEVVAPAAPSQHEEQEIARLKELSDKLASEVAQLEHLQTDNNKLRNQLAAVPDRLTAEETQFLDQARERAQAIACVNNLKQLGLAVRVWALDNKGANPPDFLSMSNEVSTPKVLVCPADTARQAAQNWAAFTAANCSYEFLAASAQDADREPQRVSFRCPIHGSITLCDGSVQMRAAKDHPDWLVEREGKLYFEAPQATNRAPKAAPEATEPIPNQ